MSRGSYARLISAHFFEQVEPQLALGCLELVIALIVGRDRWLDTGEHNGLESERLVQGFDLQDASKVSPKAASGLIVRTPPTLQQGAHFLSMLDPFRHSP